MVKLQANQKIHPEQRRIESVKLTDYLKRAKEEEGKNNLIFI
jgi:hypothetical protein